jgi:hypothetical protein
MGRASKSLIARLCTRIAASTATRSGALELADLASPNGEALAVAADAAIAALSQPE